VNTIKNELIQELDIHSAQINKAVLLYRVINNSVRQRIIRHLHAKKRMIVTELYMDLEMEQCVMSQHLAILRKSRIVKTEREGKFIYYFIDYARLEELHKLSVTLIQLDPQIQDHQLTTVLNNPGILTA
jgi:DNA-binding transcriptional ArsR family regulator